MTETKNKPALFRWTLILLLSVVMVGLSYTVLSLPIDSPGLRDRVTQALEESGVSNPVTAVLVNFRGYDTLLEMGVLLLALLGVWSLGGNADTPHSMPGPVSDQLTSLLVPLLILVAGYLLWVGGHAPGGAFQAGSVLAAAGVLRLLFDWRLQERYWGLPLRLMLVAGLAMFMVVGLAMLVMERHFLAFPPSMAGTLILIIETAAAISIGVTLAALFLGAQPGTEP